MKQNQYFKAYLDDMHKVSVFLALNNYDGLSNLFYLENEDHEQIPLTIIDDIILDGYHKYECTFSQDITFGKQYHVYHQYGRYTPLIFAQVVKTKAFDDLFFYAGNDLGCTYHKKQTAFKLWAPTAYKVHLLFQQDNKESFVSMQRKEQGVYEAHIDGDLLGAHYVFYVEVNGDINVCLDPYGKASTLNSKQSVVVDVTQIKAKDYVLPKMDSHCDAIIYEASIRDYSEKGRVLDFIKEPKGSALDYIASLGVTHIQLLPMMDFKSVDDKDISRYYNWGYDAYQWMAFENSYSSNINVPMQILKDVKTLIDACHEKGIRVNFDVVFNHVYEINDSSLENSVPYYYFQYNQYKGFSNATMCGNDVDSTRLMCRKLIVDSCVYLAKVFQIDGLRFDLMGILDVDTINEVVKQTKRINKDFMVYGEGWNMPSFLSEEKRACIANNAKMLDVAHFSDRFRDVVKGSTDLKQIYDLGYMLSDIGKCYKTMNVLGASTQEIGDSRLFVNADQSVNYVECHDNMTSWDKIDAALKVNKEAKKEHHKMLIAAVLWAQGIPFLHGGQEFARTKNGLANTYNAPDEINKVDYARMKRRKDMVRYTKEVIAIRKRYSCLRQSLAEDIHRNVSYDMYENAVLKYMVKDKNSDIIILFNPTYTMHTYELDEGYEMVFYNTLLQQSEKPRYIDIHGVSVVVLSKEKEEECK